MRSECTAAESGKQCGYLVTGRARSSAKQRAPISHPSLTTAKCTDLPAPYVWFENSCRQAWQCDVRVPFEATCHEVVSRSHHARDRDGQRDPFYFSLPLPVTFNRCPRDNGPSCYLLILFRQPDGTYSARAALAPLNEQLRGPDDAWLRLVRDEVATQQAP